MHSIPILRTGLAAVLLTILIAGCSSEPPSVAISPQTIVADGSSTVYPITAEAARRFTRQQRGADIRVSFSGTTAGMRRFCAGETDVSNASRLMNVEESAACDAAGIDYLVLPVAMDTIAVVTHFDNNWVDHLTLDELKRVWEPTAEGRVMRWNQLRPHWPDAPLVLFGRGQDSGTYDYFTSRVTGITRGSRLDYLASEDEELLAEAIAGEPHGLGFFGIGAYHRHWESIRVLAIDAGDGPVYPALETARNATYRPLTREMYLYVNVASLAQKTQLMPFLEEYFADAERWMHLTGYLPLRADTYAANRVLLQAAASGGGVQPR